MPAFQPRPGSVISLDVRGGYERLRVLPHPTAPSFAFACEGGEGIVVQVEREASRTRYAFKVMKPAHQRAELPSVCGHLRSFIGVPGLRACERYCVCEVDSPQVWATSPMFRYAMIIPWIDGPTWLDVLLSRKPVSAEASLKTARSLANCMALLESVGASHGDIASGNLIVAPDTCEIELIDVEHMHAPGFPRPSVCVLGTPGYNRVNSTEDVWNSVSDRMAVGIMLSEMLAWRERSIAAASDGASYFAPDEIGDERCDRFRLMLQVLGSLSHQLPPLLTAVWRSRRRADCPPAHAWRAAIEGLGTLARAPTLTTSAQAHRGTIPQTHVLTTPPIVPPEVVGSVTPPPGITPNAPQPTTPATAVVAWTSIAPAVRAPDSPVAFWSGAAPIAPEAPNAVVRWGYAEPDPDPTNQEPP